MKIPVKYGSKTFFVVVDKKDYPFLYRMPLIIITSRNNKHYVAVNYKGKRYRLHRFLTNCPDNKEIDHVNGNSLDNRRANLRICDHIKNMQNQKLSIRNKSGFRGVCWKNREKKWQAKITVNYKQIHLGFFDDPFVASLAYEEGRKKYFIA